MGISTAAQKGRSSVRSSAFLAGGLAVWLCGAFAVALAVAMTAVLAREAAMRAERRVADEIIAAPVDLPWVVRRIFRVVKPQVFV